MSHEVEKFIYHQMTNHVCYCCIYEKFIECFTVDVLLLQPHVGHMIAFIEHIALDEDHSDSCVSASCGLIGQVVLVCCAIPDINFGSWRMEFLSLFIYGVLPNTHCFIIKAVPENKNQGCVLAAVYNFLWVAG